MRRRGAWLAGAVLLLLGGIVGAGIRTYETTLAPLPEREPVFAESDAPFPSDSASDVVSFADHVVLVTAVAEKEVTPTATPTASGTGGTTVARDVTFRIDRALWSHPKARAAPAQFTTRWWGWLIEGRKRTPIAVAGTPWVFVGGHYVVPIAHDGTSYSVLQPSAVFRYDRGTVTLEEQDSPLARQLDQADAERVAVTFADAVPDPVAEQHRNLAPRARLTAVLAAHSVRVRRVSGSATRRPLGSRSPEWPPHERRTPPPIRSTRAPIVDINLRAMTARA